MALETPAVRNPNQIGAIMRVELGIVDNVINANRDLTPSQIVVTSRENLGKRTTTLANIATIAEIPNIVHSRVEYKAAYTRLNNAIEVDV